MISPPAPSLAERKRELVRTELGRVAWKLFAARGYEETTVAEIAAAAGVSRRTFFRYYPTKEQVLVETSDELAEEMLTAVADRPTDEPPLAALRRALGPVLERHLVEDADRTRTIIRLLRNSPSLRRAMLDRHARMEERLADYFAERLGVDGERDVRPALIGFVARALMDTAFNVWYDQERRDIGRLLDEVFQALSDLAPAG